MQRLHYLARLIEAGDLQSIGRRLLIMAYEDIGLASPQAAPRTLAQLNQLNELDSRSTHPTCKCRYRAMLITKIKFSL